MIKNIITRIFKLLGFKLIKLNSTDSLRQYSRHYSKESIKNKKFYNFGAGGFSHKFWTNVDYHSIWYKKNSDNINSGIHYDLLSLEPVKITSNDAEIVYSSHVIEHITDEAAQYFFNEAYRILKSNGTIRLTAPDVDLHYMAMINKDIEFYYWKDYYSTKKRYEAIKLNAPMDKASVEQLFIQRIAGSMSEIHADGAKNRISDKKLHNILDDLGYEKGLTEICAQCPIDIQKKYPGNHINWWNKKKTKYFLEQAGFKNITYSGYGQSSQEVLRDIEYFDNTHPACSFYIEARK